MESQSEIAVYVVIGCLVMVTSALLIFTFYTLNRRNALEKEAKIASIQHEKKIEIFKATRNAEEKQKEDIARELHDTVVASLSAAIRSMDKNIRDFDRAKFDIDRMKQDLQTIEEAKEQVRHVSHELIPQNILSHGLIKALAYHIKSIKDLAGSRAEFENKTSFDDEPPFTKTEQATIFKVCLEITNNLLKHARYKYLKVMVESDAHYFMVDFTHDGRGISNSDVQKIGESAKGIGLNSIRSRLMLINGSIDYTVGKEDSSVNLKIPIRS